MELISETVENDYFCFGETKIQTYKLTPGEALMNFTQKNPNNAKWLEFYKETNQYYLFRINNKLNFHGKVKVNINGIDCLFTRKKTVKEQKFNAKQYKQIYKFKIIKITNASH